MQGGERYRSKHLAGQSLCIVDIIVMKWLASFGKHVLLNDTNNRGDSYYYRLIPELNQYFS